MNEICLFKTDSKEKREAKEKILEELKEETITKINSMKKFMKNKLMESCNLTEAEADIEINKITIESIKKVENDFLKKTIKIDNTYNK